jgi:hypothetical protein
LVYWRRASASVYPGQKKFACLRIAQPFDDQPRACRSLSARRNTRCRAAPAFVLTVGAASQHGNKSVSSVRAFQRIHPRYQCFSGQACRLP